MKKLLFVILTLVTLICIAKDFRYKFGETKEGQPTIAYDDKDWMFLKKENDYKFFANRGGYAKTSNDLVIFHSMVVFDKPRMPEGTDIPISKVFSYGLIDCESATFSLMNDIYVDKDHKVVFDTKYEPGEYLVNLNAPDTARYEAYISVCKTTSI